MAARLGTALAGEIALDGMAFQIETSVGSAFYPEDAPGAELLLQRADVAMYLAKERQTGVETYSSAAEQARRRRVDRQIAGGAPGG